MIENQPKATPLAFSIETTPGISHVFSDPETLAHMVGVYEECGYPVFPAMDMGIDANGGYFPSLSMLRIHASSNELMSLEDFFYYRELHDVSVWSWHLVPGTGKDKGKFVWRFPKGQDAEISGPVLSVSRKGKDEVYLFGSPDDMEHVWETYRSVDKFAVRCDYTGENISCLVSTAEDVATVRPLVNSQGKTKILSTIEYTEYSDIFADTSPLNVAGYPVLNDDCDDDLWFG